MKQIILIAILIVICSCSNDSSNDGNNNQDDKKINPASVISVQVQNGKKLKSISNYRDPKFITLYAWDFKCKHKEYIDAERSISGFTEELYYRNRDTVNNRILFMGWDVIDSENNLGEFLYYKNIILQIALDTNNLPVKLLNYRGTLDLRRDKIAYIPNEVMKRNLIQITKLFDEGEYNACYQMFDTAYKFIPVTGAEYRKLVADGTEIRDTTKIY